MKKPSVNVLTLGVVFFISLLFYYIIQSLDAEFDKEAIVSRENTANFRVIYEPYNENLLFRRAITHFVYEIDKVKHNDMMLRFEVYWSRLPLIIESKEATALITISNIKPIIKTFIIELSGIEKALEGLKAGDFDKRNKIILVLKKQAELLSQMRLDTDLLLRKNNEKRIGHKTQLRNSIFYTLVFSGFMIVGIFLLFIYQLHKKSRLSAALDIQSRDLKQLAASLDKKVFERTQQLTLSNQSLSLEIIEREKIEKKIIHQAFHDTLTGLPNRQLILDRLQVLIKKARRNKDVIAVLFLDLDDFKKVNDSLGHDTGDKLLIEVSKRLTGLIREEDSVGRLGGDEFIVIIERGADILNIQAVTNKILTQLSNAFRLEGRDLLVSASIGISFYPNDGDSPEALLKTADSAMYNAKNSGRNIYSYYTDELNQAMERRLEIEENLVGSLERGEFEVLFQPKLNFKTGKINSAEALIRWKNKNLGSVSPSEFIPIVEQSSLIYDIGQFVLEQSMQFAATVRKNGSPSFSVAVNFSPQQFRSNNLVHDVEMTLDQHQLDGNALEIEITEGVLFKDTTVVIDLFKQLTSLKVVLSMDDFGTGYSSLSYLRQYPFTRLKIDRSFIADLDIDERDKELANATIAMAHSLNIQVVAEGIETKSQFNYLKQQGCDYGQGYYISKAIPADAFKKLLL